MVETVSLLNEIRSNGYEGAILTTYNLHIPFLEEVVVRRLHASGCRHVVVLADRRQLVQALKADVPRRAGYDYALIPIPASTVFHPKVMLLAGKSKGLLAVGSHNLTYAGFGHNREVTNVVRYDTGKNADNGILLRDAWHALSAWMNVGQTDTGSDELIRRLPQLAPWLTEQSSEPSEDVRLLFGGPDDTSLFEQLQSFVGESLDEVFLTGPFFDSKLEFLNRLASEFGTSRITAAIDPETAQIPGNAGELSSGTFVRANQLGGDKSKYLHAKVLFGKGESGTSYLISGSANPSAPAWLNEGAKANYEAMLALKGNIAKRAADSLGLSVDGTFDTLEDSDWTVVAEQWARRGEKSADDAASHDLVVASVDESGSVSLPVGSPDIDLDIELVGADGVALPDAPETTTGADGVLRVKLPSHQRVSLVRAFSDGDLLLLAIVHYPAVLQERAKTGVQRRFSMAFSSLDTDAPALNELFKCIEQVIDEDQPAAPSSARSGSPKQKTGKSDEPESLEISIDDLPAQHKRRHLSAGTNLGYIIDILIRSLGQDIASEYDEVDAFGRNEEEQVGSDDENTETETRTDAKAETVLKLCHKKIRRLISRAISQLDAFADERVTERNLVIKLTAVIALVSQLKAQDSHIWWINTARGESTVPQAELERLMASVSSSLLAHPLFLYEPASEDEEIPTSDEYARLRGLIFWLGACVGLTLQLKPPFNEQIQDRSARIQANQDFLSLSDLVAGDSQASQSAEELINMTDASLRRALDRAYLLRHKLDSTLGGSPGSQPIVAGDFAFNPKMPEFGVRAVLHADSQFVELATPGGNKPRRFRASNMIGIPADSLQG